MSYSLRPSLSYCLIDGHPIFLDLDEDRYFKLSGSLEEVFLGQVHDGHVDSSDRPALQALVEHGIVVPEPAPDDRGQAAPPAARSAIEMARTSPRFGVATMLEVFLVLWRVHRRLRGLPLKHVVDEVVRFREVTCSRELPEGLDEARLLAETDRFMRSRVYVPIETCCLLDSLALTRFLASRHIATRIVFGVTDTPFSAHCWVQFGDLVLTDTVGNTAAYTPIRTI